MFPEIKKQLEPKEKTREKIEKVKQGIIQKIEQQGYKAEPMGSTARNTYLPEKLDIDIFFYFSENTTEKELEEKGIKVGKKALKGQNPTTHYADHPYVKAEINGIDVDIVPCYDPEKYLKDKEKPILTQEPRSAVDRTPLHNHYLNQNLKEEQKPEVKLLKKYLHNIHCYGAEEKTRGFSGYITELLILKHGSFKKTLEAASEWKRNHKIDIENHGEKKFNDPLVIIDPVDPTRNAAAALSEEKLGTFIVKSRELLKNPTKEKYRSKTKINMQKLEQKNLILLKLPYPKETVPEIGWSQLRKLENKITKELDQQEFKVYRSTHWTDEDKEAQILLEMRNTKLPKHEKHMGPPFYKKEHAEKFIEKNQDIYIQGKRLQASRKRKNTTAKKAIKTYLESEEPEVPSRYREPVKKAKIIQKTRKIKKNKPILKKYSRL